LLQLLTKRKIKINEDRSILGYGTLIKWPVVEGGLEATGNDGMVETIQKTPYSVAYIGVSYGTDLANAGVGTAWIKNESGDFVIPTKEAIQAGAAGLGARTPPDERLSIVLSPGSDTYRSLVTNTRLCQLSRRTQQ
jgi:phosphate transport system substrate-binding protein